ncbi:hypothetical protein LP415_03605 [Polaromonas sp. P1(28)-8]|nr:hypothetical protein LP415_03605 [Polaromonas sp. P1(28)-8]
MDIETLKVAWTEILEAVEVVADGGWTTNAELIAEIWAATASMLGKQKEILPMIAAAAKLRPTIQGLQSATEALAAQCGDFATASEANARLPVDDTKILREASFLHESGKHRKCVALIKANIATLDRKHQLFGIVLALAGQSAHIIAQTDLVKEWGAILDSKEYLHPHRAVLDYLVATADNKLGNEAAIAALELRYEALGRDPSIALVLFQDLDPADSQQAKRSSQ